jgi:hypothetical protein
MKGINRGEDKGTWGGEDKRTRGGGDKGTRRKNGKIETQVTHISSPRFIYEDS